jgi:hypothetical protein
MILFYFPTKAIHQSFPGFGVITVSGGTYWIDGWDTTTKSADVAYKYIAEQTLERDEYGGYIRNADYYAAVEPEPSVESQLEAMNAVILDLVLGGA